MDPVGTALGAAALLVSIWAANRAHRLGDAQTRLQERLLNVENARERDRITQSLRAELRADIVGYSPHWRLQIRNWGKGEARAIKMRADGKTFPDHPVILARSQDLVSVLGPGADVSYILAVTMGSPLKYLVELEWEDDSGAAGNWRSELNV